MKKNKKEELQSRRQFFKRVAKGTLPILAATVLASTPFLSQASESAMGCKYGCSGSCSGSCKTTCEGSCSGGCRTGCVGSCGSNCYGTCMNSSKK